MSAHEALALIAFIAMWVARPRVLNGRRGGLYAPG